jgi:hypothetical protein
MGATGQQRRQNYKNKSLAFKRKGKSGQSAGNQNWVIILTTQK